MMKQMKFGTYRFLFQKNKADYNNVYITSNGPIFKEAGNLLQQKLKSNESKRNKI